MNAVSLFVVALRLLLSLLFLCWIISAQDIENVVARTARSHNTQYLPRSLTRNPPLAGGFQQVENVEDQPMIREAATFALQALQDTSTSPYVFGTQAKSVKVIDAWQQVVQGLNFQLTLEFLNEKDDCVGACNVQIYNQFGTLSVTNWNKEITCTEAKEMILDSEGDDN
jgi:hypothetical protein